MDSNKKYSPYHGIWVVILCMIAGPAVLTIIIESTLKIVQPFHFRVNAPSARFVGCGLGFVFHIILIVGGALREPYEALKFRISEFRENLAGSFRFALQCYWDDVRQYGAVFDICLLLILANLGYSLYNLSIALKMLQPYLH